MHKDFKKIIRSGISENLEKGNFHASQMSFRRISQFFSDDSFQCYYYIGTLKRRGHRTFFHAKSFVSLAIPTRVLARLKIRMPLYRQLLMICYGYRWQFRVLARAPTASDLMFRNVYCSESHPAAVKDSLPSPPWKIYFQFLIILAIFLLKNSKRKFEMDQIPCKTRVGWRFDRNVC